MGAYQRQAVFHLIVSLVTLIAFSALIPVLGFHRAQGAFGLMGLIGVEAIYRRYHGKSLSDERDQAIFQRAARLGFSWFWVLFVVGLLAAYHFSQPGSVISRDALILIVWLSGIALFICRSSALLALYWWNNRASAGSAE